MSEQFDKFVAEQKQKRVQEKEERDNIKALEGYLRAGTAAGCPQDQMLNFIEAGMILQPKQLQMSAAARACDHRCPSCQEKYEKAKELPMDCPDCGPTAVGVGGARGGGKSQWMFAQICLDDCQRFSGLKFLILRKSVKALREQIRDLLKKTFKNPGAYNYREQAGQIEFPNGSFIIIGHFKDESEIDNYLGQEYDGIGIEELTTLTFDKFKNLMSCLRTSKKGWRPRLYASWNWGGVGHFFVKTLFYDPWKAGMEHDTRYILATVADNVHVNPENRKILQSYTGWKYQSWYLGDPNFLAGQFFTNWSPEIHVFPNESVTFDVTKAVRWFGSMDYGFTHPNSFGLHCECDDGNFFTVRTYSQSETLIQDHAENIRDILRLHNLTVDDLEYIAAGRDCFKVDKDGSTVATEYAANGIHLTPVEIDRVNAWSKCQERLGDPSRGIRPTWFVHKSCEDLISQIAVAQCDEKRLGDVMKMNADRETGEGGDDALEMWRNAVVSEFNSVLRDAVPMQMGSYQSLNSIVSGEDSHLLGYRTLADNQIITLTSQ
jgi:hypothetical protein